ncbi:MAG: hypothetical protein AAB393_00645 [Bacteroidota bacterium]
MAKRHESLISLSGSLVDTLLQQHRHIEGLIDGMLTELGVALNKHIRLEERELFPMFERDVPEDVAVRIGEDLSRMEE